MMDEKILGFKKEDAGTIRFGNDAMYSFEINKEKLIPVVSVKWLKKYNKDYIKNNPRHTSIKAVLKKQLYAVCKQAKLEKVKRK